MLILGHFWPFLDHMVDMWKNGDFGPFLGILEPPYSQYWGSTAFFWFFYVWPICVQDRSTDNPVGSTNFVRAYGLYVKKMLIFGHFLPFLGTLEPLYGQYWGSTAIFWLFCVRPICVQVRSNENPVGSTHFVGPYGWYVQKHWFWAMFDHFLAIYGQNWLDLIGSTLDLA